MPLFDQMYYDQKWGLWDTFKAFGRNLKAYTKTTGYKFSNLVSSQNRKSNITTMQKNIGRIITAGEE